MSRRNQAQRGFDPLGWMFTFSDLITLLLTFFVMLLSMKQPEVQKLKAAFGIFSEGTMGQIALTGSADMEKFQRLLDSISQISVEDLTSVEQELAQMLELPGSQEGQVPRLLQQGVTVAKESRGTVITLANDLLFDAGSATLRPKAKEAVTKVAKMLSFSPLPVAIEGHTDSIPPAPGGAFPDNWSLSLARADAVLRQFLASGAIQASRLRLGAMGDTQPVQPNDAPEKRAMNRRTEIVLLTDGN